jgi:outer membrane protein OmpA-like peptidoglycan-associated protein
MRSLKTKDTINLNLKRLVEMTIACMVMSIFVLESVHADSIAKNRNDVYQVLDGLDSTWDLPGLDIWVNEKSDEPVVNVGDVVYFTIESNNSAFYTLIHVDSKGSTVVIKPTMTGVKENGSDYMVYPPLTDGCKEFSLNQACFNPDNQLVQSAPIGQDAVYLLASKQPIPSSILDMAEDEEFKNLDKELADIETLVRRINQQSFYNPIAAVRYTYSVESNETQYTTRSIRRKVNNIAAGSAESLVFNNINFAFNSSELTVQGQVELDGLGSALVGIQEQLGEIPAIELIGHTDSIGPEAYNMTLSKERAESAKRYLLSEHGLLGEVIHIAWKGESQPMNSNDTIDGRAMNRRVVLKAVSVE